MTVFSAAPLYLREAGHHKFVVQIFDADYKLPLTGGARAGALAPCASRIPDRVKDRVKDGELIAGPASTGASASGIFMARMAMADDVREIASMLAPGE